MWGRGGAKAVQWFHQIHAAFLIRFYLKTSSFKSVITLGQDVSLDETVASGGMQTWARAGSKRF